MKNKNRGGKKIKKGGTRVQDFPSELILHYLQNCGLRSSLFTGPLGEQFSKPQDFFSLLEKIFINVRPGEGHVLDCAELASEVPKMETPYKGTAIVVPRDEYSDIKDRSSREVPVFIKRSHLFDPITHIQGGYIMPEDGALPSHSELWRSTLAKINAPMNEAYVDAVGAVIASRLVETGKSPHWVRCFGTFNARVKEYLYNISDQLDTMRNKTWFHENQAANLFELRILDEDGNEAPFSAYGMNEKGHKDNSSLLDGTEQSMSDVDVEELQDTLDLRSDAPLIENENTELDRVLEESNLEDEVTVSLPRITLQRRSDSLHSRSAGSETEEDDGTDELESDDDEYDEGGPQVYAVFHNVPVQTTILERCEGTMDQLLDDSVEQKDKDAQWCAFVFQVITALTVAQHYFRFVHNDLHTNNIMWTKTDEKYLYYYIKGASTGDRYYRVPTFGKIMRIIDFNRATYWLGPEIGLIMSDAYEQEGDAGGQYNCAPFYDSKMQKVSPNPSFDLTRLSVSLIDSLYPDTPDPVKPDRTLSQEGSTRYLETISPLYNLLWTWLLDTDGKSILKQPNSSKERYPGFDLYRAIARKCHRALPKDQLTKPIFDTQYRCNQSDIPVNATIWEVPLINAF